MSVRENGASSGVGVLATYAYDDLGRRTSLTRGNGTSRSYSYDAVSRLSQLSEDLSGTTYDQTLGFTYSPASQIVTNTRSNDAYAWGGHYNVTKSYTSNGLNQYTVAGSASPTYDSRGNLTSAGSTTFAYTSENRLASYGSTLLAYDPLGRLHYYPGAGLAWMYDGDQLLAELNTANLSQIVRRYVYGPDQDEPIVWYEGSGTSDRRFLHADERGSVIAVTNSSGSVIGVNSYDEYGVPASGNIGRFQYTGQAWMSDVGLYYYKAQMYSSGLGRFLQTDLIGYRSGMNLYVYVVADPVNLTDPSGLDIVVKNCKMGKVLIGDHCYTQEEFNEMVQAAQDSDTQSLPGFFICKAVPFKVTAIGPTNANGDSRTAITQVPGNTINLQGGDVAIKPQNFGVPTVAGHRDVLKDVVLVPIWRYAVGEGNVTAAPRGLPSWGPYHPADDIYPPNVRAAPGNHIDLYRWSDDKDAWRATRVVPVVAIIPDNSEGIECPTGSASPL